MRHFVFLIAIFVSLIPELRADGPFFKPGDVVTLVGGEDMVVAAELGYLETLIQLALPDHHLKFRSLAREGDTVFEQRRDLNYPKLEDQLDKIGATVVICQFGQMESLAGKEKVGEFVAAYEKLIGRLSGEGKRRVVVIEPPYFNAASSWEMTKESRRKQGDLVYAVSGNRTIYIAAIQEMVRRIGSASIPMAFRFLNVGDRMRDGVHISERQHPGEALALAVALGLYDRNVASKIFAAGAVDKPTFKLGNKRDDLTALITAKNCLWFHYYRPQNWAFLAGDRTNQPSSRDHLDPSKRWFPEELEKFVPLIDAKDAEIWALAKKLSAGGKN